MKLKYLRYLSLASLTALIFGILAAGCGGGSEDSSQQKYQTVLQHLEHAAFSGSSYKATRRADELDAEDRDVLRAFCEFAWEIGVNHEAWKLSDPSYSVRRIRADAFGRGNASLGSIGIALRQLRAAYDVRTFNAKTLRRYTKACYS